METPQVRPLAEEDFEVWRGLWLAYDLFCEKPEVPEPVTRALWSRIFDPAEPVHALVAGPPAAFTIRSPNAPASCNIAKIFKERRFGA